MYWRFSVYVLQVLSMRQHYLVLSQLWMKGIPQRKCLVTLLAWFSGCRSTNMLSCLNSFQRKFRKSVSIQSRRDRRPLLFQILPSGCWLLAPLANLCLLKTQSLDLPGTCQAQLGPCMNGQLGVRQSLTLPSTYETCPDLLWKCPSVCIGVKCYFSVPTSY